MDWEPDRPSVSLPIIDSPIAVVAPLFPFLSSVSLSFPSFLPVVPSSTSATISSVTTVSSCCHSYNISNTIICPLLISFLVITITVPHSLPLLGSVHSVSHSMRHSTSNSSSHSTRDVRHARMCQALILM